MSDQHKTTRWRPVSEAPRQEEVLVCRSGLNGWWAVAWCCALGEWRRSEGMDRLPHEPSHWQPLEAPPRVN